MSWIYPSEIESIDEDIKKLQLRMKHKGLVRRTRIGEQIRKLQAKKMALILAS